MLHHKPIAWILNKTFILIYKWQTSLLVLSLWVKYMKKFKKVDSHYVLNNAQLTLEQQVSLILRNNSSILTLKSYWGQTLWSIFLLRLLLDTMSNHMGTYPYLEYVSMMWELFFFPMISQVEHIDPLPSEICLLRVINADMTLFEGITCGCKVI